jgi:hypothetical protein
MPIYNPNSDKPLGTHGWFANCCGATFTGSVKNVRINSRLTKGIRVIDGLHGDPRDIDGKVEVSHVKTKNGDITVAVQYAVDPTSLRNPDYGW